MLIVSIYRPPSANSILFIDTLSEPLSILPGNSYDESILPGNSYDEIILPGNSYDEIILPGNSYDEIILCGDLNLDILNYDNKEKTLKFLNSLESHSLIPIITKLPLITD